MVRTLRLDGKEYDISALGEQGLQNLAAYQHATAQMQEATNMMALLTKAKNAYIAELKTEIIQGRTGVDLSSLLSD
jgi:hypothetical protein